MVGRRQFLIVTSSAISAGMTWPWGAQAAWRVAALPCALPPVLPSSLPLQPMGHTGDIEDGNPPSHAAGESRPTPPSPALLIFDPAFALACAVASEARLAGQPTLGLEGDAGTFWYRSVLPLLQSDGMPEHRLSLNGLTPHATFFVLSTLATAAGMSVSNRSMSAPLAASGSEVRAAFPDHPALSPFATISDNDRHLVAWHIAFPTARPSRQV
jgi:hypothetical protein